MVEDWLLRLPCPSIALTPRPAKLRGFDLCVSTQAEAERLTDVIKTSPVACTVLVQTLRIIENVPAQQGLVIESLAFAVLQQGDEFRRWLRSRPVSAWRPKSAVQDTPPVLTERRGQDLTITLNRPESRNAVDTEMRDALFDIFASAAMEQELKRIHVRGAGDSFSIGGALEEFGKIDSGGSGHVIRTERLPARMLADHGHRYHFHLQGACVGAGVEIAAFGGFVSATPTTFLRLPEISMGLIPGAGGCVSVTRRIGRQAAAWMMMTGTRVGARTALKCGLIDAIETEGA
jgi:enoyl-CoA hydratase/carnithine racemase